MKNKDTVQRRDFLKASAVGLGALATSRVPSLFAKSSPNERVVVAVMGLNGRGMVHARSFARGANTTVAYLCDVDSNVLAKAMSSTAKDQATAKALFGTCSDMIRYRLWSISHKPLSSPEKLSCMPSESLYTEKPGRIDKPTGLSSMSSSSL